MFMLRLTFATALLGSAAFAATPVTFNKDVLPILQQNCQQCHRPGEVRRCRSLRTRMRGPGRRRSKRRS